MTLNSEPTKDSSKSRILVKNSEKIDTEKISKSVWLERRNFRIALIGTLAALAIVLGYLLVNFPNIEVFTMMIFLSGFILSKKEGALIGLLSGFIYHFFMKCFWNPDISFKDNSVINYDWYYPQICSRHTIEEIRSWFDNCGIKINHEYADFYGITMRGQIC